VKSKASLITALLLTLAVEVYILMSLENFQVGIHKKFHLVESEFSNGIYRYFWIFERLCLFAYFLSILINEIKLFQRLEEKTSGQAFRKQDTLYEVGWTFLISALPLLICSAIAVALYPLLPQKAVYTIFCGALALLSFLLTFIERKKNQLIVRGDALLSHEEAKAKAEKLSSTKVFYWGGLWLPLEDSVKHMLIIGEPGSGKSKTLQLFFESVLSDIGLGLNHKAIIYDPKRNTRSLLAGMELNCPVHILDPFDKRCVAWDIAKDIDEPDIARTVAESLISEEPGSSQPYFRDTAAVIVCAVMQALHIRKPYAWSLRDLVLVMRSSDNITRLVSSVPETKHYVDQHCSETGQAFQSVLSTASGKIDWLTSIAALWDGAKEKISLRDWVRNDESILLLSSDNLRHVAMSELNRMILTYLILALLDLPDDSNRRVWFGLDEFTSLGKIKMVQDLLYKGRSKGASAVVAFQEIAQLIEHYGKEGQRIITANTSNKVILRSSDPDTQKWEQSFFGIQEKYEESYSKNASLLGARASFGKSETIRERSLVLPSEFGTLHLASPDKGISGFAKLPSIGSYRFNVPGRFVDTLAKPDPNTPDFEGREAEDRKIKPFTKDEEASIYGEQLLQDSQKLELRSQAKTKRQENLKEKIRESITRIENR